MFSNFKLISIVNLFIVLSLIVPTIHSFNDELSFKDTLIIKSSRKFINFDIPNFELNNTPSNIVSSNSSSSKLICLQFKFASTDNNENKLLKLYLVNKKTNEVCEKLWSSKLLFSKQKIYEELNIDTEILNENANDYQLQFRVLNNDDDETSERLSIEDILVINSVKINNDYCQTRTKCIKNDCLWNTFIEDIGNQTATRNIIKLKSSSQISQKLVSSSLVDKLNLNLKDNNIYFIINNKNKLRLNETIYSPVLKLSINLDEIQLSFDCRSLNTECLPNENIFVEYKFAEEYPNLYNLPKLLIHFNKQTYKNKFNDEKIDKFIFKLSARDFIAKQVDIVFWIQIKLKSNQTLVLSNIEIKNYLARNLEWKSCNLSQTSSQRKFGNILACDLEQLNSHHTNKVIRWSIVNDDKTSKLQNYLKLKNDKTASHIPNELYLPRNVLSENNQNCVFKFKFNTKDVNFFVYFVDDHKRIVKIWERDEDALMYLENKSNWTEVSIYMGNIYKGFRLFFSVEKMTINSSLAIGDLEFENCQTEQQSNIEKSKRPNDLDIIKISYQEPKLINEQSIYKCNFEHETIEECGLVSDQELLDETCPEDFCTQSEWLRSLDNFDGMNHLQLPFRDYSKNFGINGHYIYLQNMNGNSNNKVTKAILRFKRTLSNKLKNTINHVQNNQNGKANATSVCKMNFYLRTNGYRLVDYDVFVDLISSNRLVRIKTELKFSKLNFYELNQVSFENINEPFQVLLLGSIKHNYVNQDTFIYLAIDDLSFTEDCLFL